MGTYTNRDGSPKGPFEVGDPVRVIAKKDPDAGRVMAIVRVRGNAVWLQPDRSPVPLRFWSYEIEAA